MKKFVLLLVLALYGHVCLAQSMRGYVKTKGRMVDGKVVHGVGLSGVTIRIKGMNVVMSGKDGLFFISLPQNHKGDNIYVELISKPGFELIDKDILNRPIIYNPSTPLSIVMEEESILAKERLAIEKKLRVTLQHKLIEKEDELEALKEQHQISDEAYRRQLQELYNQQKNNETLIGDMVDRYSKIDFDEVDEFNRRLSQLIFDGKLAEVDSLINAKGDMNLRVADYRQLHEANIQKLKQLEKDKAWFQKERETLAQDCLARFKIFKMKEQNDSAAYYLELRAQMDTTDYKLATETGMIFINDLADDDKALKYFNLAKDITTQNYGFKNPDVALSYQNIGNVYLFRNDYYEAVKQFNMSKDLYRGLMGDSTRHVGQSQILLGITYNAMKKYDLALDYYKQALDIFDNIFKENKNPEIANIYNNMGVTYENKKDYKQAFLYYQKALKMRKELYDYEHPEIAYSYSNIAGVFDHMEEFDKAIAYYQKSIDVLRKSKGSKHQDIGLMYNNIAATYYNMDELSKSLSYFNQALEIMQIFLPEDHPNIRAIEENIETVKNEIKRN